MYRLFLAQRYLRTRLVNLLSVGGVMVGVGVLIVVVSIMDGFQDQVKTVVRGNLSHLILTPREEVEPFESLEAALRREFPEVEAVSPQLHFFLFHEYQSQKLQVLGEGNRAFHQLTAIGVRWAYEARVSSLPEYLLCARHPDQPFRDDAARAREKRTVLVSRAFAERFLGTPPPPEGGGEPQWEWLLGREVRVMLGTIESGVEGEPALRASSYNLVVSGVYDAHDTVQDLGTCYMDIDQLRGLIGLDKARHEYSELRVRLGDYRHAEALKPRLAARLPGFVVETWEDQRADFLRAVDTEKVMLVIVLSFITLLSGFIILATLTLTVVEKTKDIGIVAALGGSSTGILSIFLFNGLLIGVLGSVLGLGLGWVFTENVNAIKDWLAGAGVTVFDPNVYHFRHIPTIWNWPSVLAIMLGSAAVAFLAGLVPALRAARMDPIRALRYE